MSLDLDGSSIEGGSIGVTLTLDVGEFTLDTSVTVTISTALDADGNNPGTNLKRRMVGFLWFNYYCSKC